MGAAICCHGFLMPWIWALLPCFGRRLLGNTFRRTIPTHLPFTLLSSSNTNCYVLMNRSKVLGISVLGYH